MDTEVGTAERMLARHVFSVGDRVFRWEEVVTAARAWGNWAMIERRARESLECIREARSAGRRLTGGEFEREAISFRRSRRLLAAEELEAWLESRGVDRRQWARHIQAVVLLRETARAGEPPSSPGADPEPAAARSPGADPELAAAAWVEAMCSGALDQVAYQLAARAAVVACASEAGDPSVVLTGAELDWMEQELDRFSAGVAPADAVARELERRRLDWLLVKWRYQAATERDVVHEAALCVSQDGLAFEEVAAAAGLEVRHGEALMEDIEQALRLELLTARPGAVVGPLPVGDEYWLVEVVMRREPTIENEDLRERAKRELVVRAVQAEVAGRVTWHERI